MYLSSCKQKKTHGGVPGSQHWNDPVEARTAIQEASLCVEVSVSPSASQISELTIMTQQKQQTTVCSTSDKTFYFQPMSSLNKFTPSDFLIYLSIYQVSLEVLYNEQNTFTLPLCVCIFFFLERKRNRTCSYPMTDFPNAESGPKLGAGNSIQASWSMVMQSW